MAQILDSDGNDGAGVTTGDMTYASPYKTYVAPLPVDLKDGTYTRAALEAKHTAMESSYAQACAATGTSKFDS
jgi:hypothetical protein